MEETIEFMQKRVEQERVERSAKYTPPKPVRKPIFDPEFGFACPPPGPDGVFYCIIP